MWTSPETWQRALLWSESFYKSGFGKESHIDIILGRKKPTHNFYDNMRYSYANKKSKNKRVKYYPENFPVPLFNP